MENKILNFIVPLVSIWFQLQIVLDRQKFCALSSAAVDTAVQLGDSFQCRIDESFCGLSSATVYTAVQLGASFQCITDSSFCGLSSAAFLLVYRGIIGILCRLLLIDLMSPICFVVLICSFVVPRLYWIICQWCNLMCFCFRLTAALFVFVYQPISYPFSQTKKGM